MEPDFSGNLDRQLTGWPTVLKQELFRRRGTVAWARKCIIRRVRVRACIWSIVLSPTVPLSRIERIRTKAFPKRMRSASFPAELIANFLDSVAHSGGREKEHGIIAETIVHTDFELFDAEGDPRRLRGSKSIERSSGFPLQHGKPRNPIKKHTRQRSAALLAGRSILVLQTINQSVLINRSGTYSPLRALHVRPTGRRFFRLKPWRG